MRTPRTALAATVVAAALLGPATAAADTVTTLADSGAGSLRSEIALASPGDTIGFQPGLTGTIVLASELLIDKNLTIAGPAAQDIALSGDDATRVFRITGGANATIQGLTIRDGRAGGDEPVGAGVLSFDGGTITLDRVELIGNEARKTGSIVPFGGAVAVFDGELRVTGSTVAGNLVTGEGGGGGLFVAFPATFALSDSTITDNDAYGGGGILSGLATGSIVSTTIAGNRAAHVGGGIGTFAPGVTIERSLVTGNSATNGGPACDGALGTAGGNVIDSIAGCGISPVAGDATGVPAPLGVLAAHAGPTRTMLPLAGNPAIDRLASCTGADQRGVARPQGPGCDAGAVELRRGLSASSPLVLGSAPVGLHSAAAAVAITNIGELDAVITAVTLGGPDAAEVETVPDPAACTDATVLAPAATCMLKARLSPATAGAKTAIYSVAMAGSVLDVPITGTGDAPPPPPSDPGTGGSQNPTPTPSADAVLVGTSAKAKRGKLKLRLRCTTVSADRCIGSLTLKIGARKLTKTYSIVAGKEAFVTLKLKAGDRRKLARKSLKSAVTVVTTQPDGSRRTTHQGSFKLLRG